MMHSFGLKTILTVVLGRKREQKGVERGNCDIT